MSRKYNTGGKMKKYLTGGDLLKGVSMISKVASPILAMTGVGAPIAAGVGILGQVAGMASNEIAANETPQQVLPAPSANPYGKFAYGGKFKLLSSNTVNVNGPKHKDGGVKIPAYNAEVEGEESINFNSGDPVVMSDRLKIGNKSISSLNKKLAGFVNKAEKSNSIIDKSVAMRAERGQKFLEIMQEAMQPQAPAQKFANGGPLSRNQYGFYGDVTPEDITKALGNGIFNITDPKTMTDPEQVKLLQERLGVNVDGLFGPETLNALINYGNQLKSLQSSTLSSQKYSKPSQPSIAKKAIPIKNQEGSQEGSLGLTTGDKLQLAGNAVGPIANLAAYAFSKPETQKLYQNNAPISRNQIDPRDALNEINLQSPRRFGRRSTNVEQAMQLGTYGTKTDAINRIMGSTNRMNAQLDESYQARLGQRESENINYKSSTDQVNAQNRAARRQFLIQGLGQLGQGAVNFGAALNQNALNNQYADLLGEIAPNFTYKNPMSGNVSFRTSPYSKTGR